MYRNRRDTAVRAFSMAGRQGLRGVLQGLLGTGRTKAPIQDYGCRSDVKLGNERFWT